MGLDSYLYTASKELANKVADWMEDNGYEPDDFDVRMCRNRGIIGYWRKYSPLHSWMVENVQGGEDDCGMYEIGYIAFSELYDTVCKEYDKPGSTDFQPTTTFFYDIESANEWNRFALEKTYFLFKFIMENIEDGKDTDCIRCKGEDEWDARFMYHGSW